MNIREHHSIIIEKYPYFESLNKKLLKDVEEVDYSLSYKTNVKAKMSSWRTTSTSSMDIVKDWVISILHIKYSWIYEEKYKLFFPELWFAEYNKNDHANIHDHTPFSWSFVYFIQCPKGSAPLIFTSSGKKIKAEEGKIVIFPSSVKHHVPTNKCNDRIVMAGNICIDTRGW